MGDDWKFKGYEKIPERMDEWGLDERAHRALARADWVVTEKVHGAHFVLVTDGREVRPAKRKAFLDPQDDFYGHAPVTARLTAPVLALFANQAQAFLSQGKLERLWVHGELFGGGYPHPQVPPVPDVQPVQTGVWYAPGVEFMAYDLGVEWKGYKRFVDFDAAAAAAAAAGVPFAKPLFQGSMRDALAFPHRFQSTLPARLGLPPLADNWAEGIVCKPVPGQVVGVRPVVKRKIAEFAEDERFHQATARAVPVPGLDPVEWLVLEAAAHCTENRLQSALSKAGPLKPGDGARAREVFGLMVADVLEALQTDHPAPMQSLGPASRKVLRKAVEQGVRALLAR
jgi:Rnl2 family RNA ligase